MLYRNVDREGAHAIGMRFMKISGERNPRRRTLARDRRVDWCRHYPRRRNHCGGNSRERRSRHARGSGAIDRHLSFELTASKSPARECKGRRDARGVPPKLKGFLDKERADRPDGQWIFRRGQICIDTDEATSAAERTPAPSTESGSTLPSRLRNASTRGNAPI